LQRTFLISETSLQLRKADPGPGLLELQLLEFAPGLKEETSRRHPDADKEHEIEADYDLSEIQDDPS
jgi:hypothetical protein